MTSPYDVVIPTIGRPSLARLLRSLAQSQGPPPGRIIVVDDRPDRSSGPLSLDPSLMSAGGIALLESGGRGPAAARNRGWRSSSAPWIAFLDDDVTVDRSWRRDLVCDLAAAGEAAATQGRVSVPLPADRRPSDWERNVKALERTRWITADCAFRRDALVAVGGFDERFVRAYREDTDLALRLTARGFTLARGRRRVRHEVRPADPLVSVRLQAGNADGAVSAAAGVVWLAATAQFAWRRIEPGPRCAREVATMCLSSALIPFAAVYHHWRGRRAARALRRRTAAVLFDRDGTLIADVPVLSGPRRVVTLPGAREALDRLRSAGIALGVITNQEAVARGAVTRGELARVHRRIEEMLGPFDVWAVCAHDRTSRCDCRKPKPGLVLKAARRLGFAPSACVVVGDIFSDVAAAQAAGARSVLVPNAMTRQEEIARAPLVAADLGAAVEVILAGAV